MACTSDKWPHRPPPGPADPSPGLRFDQLTGITCLPAGGTRAERWTLPSILEREQALPPPDNTTQSSKSLRSDSGCQTHKIRQIGPTQCTEIERNGIWVLTLPTLSLEAKPWRCSVFILLREERGLKPGLVPKMVMCSVFQPAKQSKSNTD